MNYRKRSFSHIKWRGQWNDNTNFQLATVDHFDVSVGIAWTSWGKCGPPESCPLATWKGSVNRILAVSKANRLYTLCAFRFPLIVYCYTTRGKLTTLIHKINEIFRNLRLIHRIAFWIRGFEKFVNAKKDKSKIRWIEIAFI